MYDSEFSKFFDEVFGIVRPSSSGRAPIKTCGCGDHCGPDCDCGCHDDEPNRRLPITNVIKSSKDRPLPMKTDAYAENGLINLKVDLPGFAKEDIKVSFKNKMLIVSASKNTEKTEETAEDTNKVREIFTERSQVSCSRAYPIRGDYAVEDFKVTYENGVLHVTFPEKKECDDKNTEIKIN